MSQSQKFAINLLHYLLKEPSSNVKIKKNTFPILSDASMCIHGDESPENDLFGANAVNVIKYMAEQLAAIRVGGTATFQIDGYTYIFNRHPNSTNLSVTQYKKIDVKDLPLEYQTVVTLDPVEFKKMFLRITADFPRGSFANNKQKKGSVESIILSADTAEFCTDSFLDLCEQFPEAFSEQQLVELKSFRQVDFSDCSLKGYNKDLNKMFENWTAFLLKNTATAAQPFVFNDSDNAAYLEETEQHKMMVQKGQNTVYVYIMDKVTNHIKVWNSCEIYPASECDLAYYSEQKKTYFEAVTSILNPYSYDIYYANLDHLASYIKTPSYYLNHFDSNFEIIYDNQRGYNVHSLHSQNLMSDFVLLNDILKYYK